MSTSTQDDVSLGPQTPRQRHVFSALIEASANWRTVHAEHFDSRDWSVFIESAEYHGVLPVAAQRVLESSLTIPDDQKDKLRSSFHQAMLRSFPLVQEILRITRTFAEHKLHLIP